MTEHTPQTTSHFMPCFRYRLTSPVFAAHTVEVLHIRPALSPAAGPSMRDTQRAESTRDRSTWHQAWDITTRFRITTLSSAHHESLLLSLIIAHHHKAHAVPLELPAVRLPNLGSYRAATPGRRNVSFCPSRFGSTAVSSASPSKAGSAGGWRSSGRDAGAFPLRM